MTYPQRMRIAVDAEDDAAGRVEIRLLPDDFNLMVGTFRASDGHITLVVDLPTWVSRRALDEMLAADRFEIATQEST